MIVATRTYNIEILCNHAWSTRIRFRTVVPNTRRLLLSEPYAFPPDLHPEWREVVLAMCDAFMGDLTDNRETMYWTELQVFGESL